MLFKLRCAAVILTLAVAGCGGSGGGGGPDAGAPDATVSDAGGADALPAAGHAGAALVPAGATSTSARYRFVGTLSAGAPATSPAHGVRTGVVGATQ